ncbi:MAG TPA: AAA family ATPase [Thermoguttaceae bacterium]|nr:AAA family ATPase [Thermoguttaceae bacterium]
MPVSSLQFTNLGPFEEVSFEFDPQVNVFVGPNNCGKTTVLLALADILVDPFTMPEKLLRGQSRFSVNFAGVPGARQAVEGDFPIRHRSESPFPKWGAEDLVTIQKTNRQLGYRTFVPAIRLSTEFRAKGPGALAAATSRAQERNAWWIRDEEVVQQIIDLDYLGYRQENAALRKLISKVGQVASRITEGFPIEFVRIAEDKNGLFPQFNTPDGTIPLNVLSQGTQSVIQWCADLLIGYAKFYDFPKSLDDKPGVLIIDEIDAHLHPSWQRRILPVLTEEFPSLQIFCATHSPLTLSGLKAGQVQLLKRDAKGKITVSRNETDIQGWSADEIYGTLLGVEPTDLATTQKLDRVHELRRKEGKLSPKEKRELESLREELHQGLAAPFLAQQADVLASRLKQAARDSAKGKGKPAPPKKTAKSAKRSTKKTAPARRRRKR